jgi:alpha-beta hydrolase superfamily lysophospholipase
MIIPESETNSICKKISFKSNGFLIKGTLHLPELKYPPVVIGVHGLFSSSDSPKQIELAKKCNALNIAFFRFDHRGCGKSEGVFRDVTSFEARQTDLISAVKTIYSRNDIGNRIGLFGSSLGGTVCISIANILKIEALVTFAAPIRSKPLIEALDKSNHLNNLPLSFCKTNLNFDISDKLPYIHNVLIFHGDSDKIVPLSNSNEIYSKSGNPKKIIIQSQGDHRMSNKYNQTQFLNESALWFKKRFAT